MSHRPWPDDRQPTADELIEWCRTGMTADVEPYVARLLESGAVVARVTAMRDQWLSEARYGPVSRAADYRWRANQLTQAITGPEGDQT